jgi:hypothetical protein
MPEFVMPLATLEEHRAMRSYSEFAQGYLQAMFFTEHDVVRNKSLGALSPEAIGELLADCTQFETAARADLDASSEVSDRCDDTQAGRDFWYTRNGAGAGFWDGDWPEPFAKRLDALAKSFGRSDLIASVDGQLHLYPYRRVT